MLVQDREVERALVGELAPGREAPGVHALRKPHLDRVVVGKEHLGPAIAQSAAAIILVHNHPSGDPTPSAEDRAITKQISEVGRTVGISIVDHVVIGDGRFASLAEDGALG